MDGEEIRLPSRQRPHKPFTDPRATIAAQLAPLTHPTSRAEAALALDALCAHGGPCALQLCECGAVEALADALLSVHPRVPPVPHPTYAEYSSQVPVGAR